MPTPMNFQSIAPGVYGPGLTPVRNYDDSIALSFCGGLVPTQTIASLGSDATAAFLNPADNGWFYAKSTALDVENARSFAPDFSIFNLDMTGLR